MKVTLTLAEDGGNVTRIRISNEDGGIKRSPFLTAPLTRIVRAFGVDRILSDSLNRDQRSQSHRKEDKNMVCEFEILVKYLSTSCKTRSRVCGLLVLPPTKGKRLRAHAYNPTARSP